MAIDLNAEPYNDDFDEKKNFYQILFRPGYSVQARELTQLQTILRDQIKKFGNHIFKHGSIVIPGHSSADIGAPYVKVQSTYNELNIDTTLFVDKVIVGSTSGVKAAVKKIIPASGNDPLTFYIMYTSGGNDGAVTFLPEEEIYVESNTDAKTNVRSGSDAVGQGGLAHISAGVYYVNGSFVYVEKQATPLTGLVSGNNTKYTVTPNCHVLLKIVESVVDHTMDETLLDNAQGAYNYAAPGADRLKIYLELTTLPLGTTITNDYIEIMRYRDGVLEEHAKNARYSELEKALARRTYDESGNYVVNGLAPQLKEHLKKELNEGVFAPSAGGDVGKFVVDVTPGKAYIQGFENEKIAHTRIVADKARTNAHIKETNINLRPSYGQYMVVSDIKGPFNIKSSDLIELYDTASDLSGQTEWTATTAVTSGQKYAYDGRLYVATTTGITGNVGPTHVDKINSVPNADLWMSGASALANTFIYYANRLYKVKNTGTLGSSSPTHVVGEEVNTAQGKWDNNKRVATGDTFYYENTRKDPDVSSLYRVITPVNNPYVAGTNIVTGHFGGLVGNSLSAETSLKTGTSSVTISNGGLYGLAPDIVISPPDHPEGTQATATVTLTSGVITEVNITNGGSGYLQPPEITINRADGDTGYGTPPVAVNAVITYTATMLLGDSALPTLGVWNAATAYLTGARVLYSGVIYKRLTDGTTATAPVSDATNWSPIPDFGVEPRFVAGATVSNITSIAYNNGTYSVAGPGPIWGSGRVTITVANASDIANLQVGEYITITGATATNGTNATRLNTGTALAPASTSPSGLGWIVVSKPSATTFTIDTAVALNNANITYTNLTGIEIKTTGKMVNAKLFMPGMSVNRGDIVWVPGATSGTTAQRQHRAYLVTNSTTPFSAGTTYPTGTGTNIASGNATLSYIGTPALLEYAGSPVTLEYFGNVASFRYEGSAGQKIGSARAIAIDYLAGDPTTNSAIYKLWVTDVKVNAFQDSLDDVGAVKYNNGADYAFALGTFDIPLTQGVFTAGERIVHDTTGRTAVVKYYDPATSKVYAYRNNSAIQTPQKGDEVRGTTSGTRGNVQNRTMVTTAGQSSLIFQLPKDIPASIKSGEPAVFKFRYIAQKEIPITITTLNGTNSSSNIGDGTILPIELGSFLAIGANGVIPNSFFSLSAESNAVSVNFGGLTDYGPTGQVIKVYCNVLKTNDIAPITPKTKDITERTETIVQWSPGVTVNETGLSGGPQKLYYGNNLYVVTSSGALDSDEADFPTDTTGNAFANGTAQLKYIGTMDSIPLDKADIIQLVSVTDTNGDITVNYTVNNGQTDYAYLRGTVKKIPNRPSPTGSIDIVYQYYMHSGNGDFFCIDSYLEGTVSAIDKKIIYQSPSTGINHDLTSCIDFRPTVGDDGTFDSGTAKLSDLIVSGTSFDSPLRYYVPRIDSLVIDQSGEITLVPGTPAEKAVEPTIPSGQFELNRFFIPAFTRNVADIQVKRMDVERFTMKDIKEIVNRVERIEEFSTLTASEVAVTAYEVKDAATGLNRFKSGYLVETFKNPFTIARTTDGDYAASFVGEVLAAPIEELICDLVVTNSTTQVTLPNGKVARNTADGDGFVIRGGCLMLPYTEEVFAQQPLSSRVTNLNPFLMIKWDGIVQCDPPSDFWVETMQLPTIYEKVNETVTIRWNSPVPEVQRQVTYSSINDGLTAQQRTIKPAPIQLVAYRITQPDGHTYTTVGAPGKYEKPGDARVEVIGSTTINQRADGASTTRAIDEAAKRIGGRGTVITDDVYKQIAHARTSDALSLTIR